nr:immunoglobulin light chain junction region [Macaca mulatta]MOV61227.1 immunoglobulin light chain junction region [Macaca mulatta]MOV61740.1 immunoglobulin light chain junction region [Macaca mulatta]MOV63423.1 immunoglobulin light chain junction region [Macaca mulatta]MOV64044.1 immunoglobulin light chain junction region [Macaca mulatta]
CQQHNSYPHSF